MFFLWSLLTLLAPLASSESASAANIARPLSQDVTIAIMSEAPGADIDSPSYLAVIPKATELALDEEKQKLAKLGIKLKLQYYFYRPVPMAAYETASKVLQSSALAAVGFQSTVDVIEAAPLFKGTNFLALSPDATSTAVLKLAPNYLMLPASNLTVARATEKFAFDDLKAKRPIALVAWDNSFSRNFYESLSKTALDKIDLVKINDNLDNFETTVPSILAKDPDLIILPNFPVNSASVIKILSKAGYKGIFIGPDSWGEDGDTRFMGILAGVEFAAYTIRQFSRLHLTKTQKDFQKRLKKKSESEYSVVPVLYYDSLKYIVKLMERLAGKKDFHVLSRETILKESFTNKKFKGVMGLNCLSEPACPGRVLSVLKVGKAGFSFYKNISGDAVEK